MMKYLFESLSDSCLDFRCQQLEELLKCSNERISRLETKVQEDAETWQTEKCSLVKELNEGKTKLEAARESNHKTMLKNQQLREKYFLNYLYCNFYKI